MSGTDTRGGADDQQEVVGPTDGDAVGLGAAAPTSREPRPGEATRREERSAPATAREPRRPPATSREPLSAMPTVREGGRGGEQRPRRRRVVLPEPVLERYEHEFDLPGGAQADLAVCRDRRTGRQVVVKLYRGAISTADLERARALGAENPDHVVPAELGTWEGEVWEIQEYFPLGSLADLAERRGGSLRPEEVRDVVRELATALTFIHDHGLVHRDLKPQNVLVRHEDPLDCVVADFGLATELLFSRDVRSVAGTWAYSAPESLYGVVTRVGDWWAVGVIFYELLVGRHPFSDPETGALLPEHLLRVQVAECRYSLEPVAGERWRLLLRGLLTADYEHRWNGEQVEQWLAGGEPPVPEARVVPGAGSGMSQPSGAWPFAFAEGVYREPAALAAAFRTHWQQAGDLLAGRDAEELVRWLRATPVAEGATRVLAAGRAPGATLVALQLVMDPGAEPSFRGHPLTAAALTALAGRAADGDADAAAWIRALRDEQVLQAWASESSEGDSIALAGSRLQQWWQGIDRLRGSLGTGSEASQVWAVATTRSEGLLLRAAFDSGMIAALREDARRQLDAKPELPAWSGGLLPALTPDKLTESAGHCALAVTLVPAAAAAERARRAAQEVAEQERERQRRADEAEREVVARELRRRDRRREARGRVRRRVVWGVVYSTVAAAGSIGMSGRSWTMTDFLTGFAACAAVIAAAILIVLAWESVAGVPALAAGRAFATIGLVTGVVLLIDRAMDGYTHIGVWFPPPVALLVGYLLGRVVAQVVEATATRSGADVTSAGRPSPSRRVLAWVSPLSLLGLLAGLSWAFTLFAAEHPGAVAPLLDTPEGLRSAIDSGLSYVPELDLSWLGGALPWVGVVVGSLIVLVYAGNRDLRRYGDSVATAVAVVVIALGIVLLMGSVNAMYVGVVFVIMVGVMVLGAALGVALVLGAIAVFAS